MSKKRKQIIRAASEEFLQKGLDAASMHHIAERAEVSKRTLYKYFPNKDVLYNSLIDALLEDLHDMYEFEYIPGSPMKEQLERVVESRIEHITSEDFLNISRIVIGELVKSRKPSKEQSKKLYYFESLFVEWVEAAKRDGQITSNLESEVIAEQFHSIVKGQIFFPALFRSVEVTSSNIREIRDQTVAFFLNAYCR